MPLVFVFGMLAVLVMLCAAVPPIVIVAITDPRGRKVFSVLTIEICSVMDVLVIIYAADPLTFVESSHLMMSVSVLTSVLVLRLIGKVNWKASIIYGLILMLLTTGLAYKSIAMQADANAGVADSYCRSTLQIIGTALEQYNSDKKAMPPKKKWREALRPYLKDYHKDILTRAHYAGDGPKVDESNYIYTGININIDSSSNKPLVYCHHKQYFATPPRTIMLCENLKVIIIPDK